MNGYSRGQGGRSYHKGVAAGFEYDDSSGDEFMFDDGDDDDKKTKGPRQGVFNIRPENNTVKPKYHTSAPWLQNGSESDKQLEEDIKPKCVKSIFYYFEKTPTINTSSSFKLSFTNEKQ